MTTMILITVIGRSVNVNSGYLALNHDGELMEIVEDDAPMNSQR
jgi:hypothetical protein